MRDYKVSNKSILQAIQIDPIKEAHHALLVAVFHEDEIGADEAYELLIGKDELENEKYVDMSDEDLLEILINYYYKNNKIPKYSDIKQSRTLYDRFGSLDNALILAGVPTKYEKRHKEVNGILYKLCNKCDEWIPSTNEYFNKNNKSNSLRNSCKECQKEYNREQYKKRSK